MNQLAVRLKENKREYACMAGGMFCILLMLVPMLLLAQYSNIATDDYVILNVVKNNRQENVPLLMIALKQVNHSFFQWQGAYFAAFSMPFFPTVLQGNEGAPLTNSLLIGAYFASVVFLSRSCMFNLLNEKKWSIVLGLSAGVLFVTTQFTNASEFFYWAAGIAGYSLPMVCLLFGFGVYGYSLKATGKKKWVFGGLAGLFLILACGGILSFGVVVCMVMLPVAFFSWKSKAANTKITLMVTAMGCLGAFANLLAPGNFVRQAAEAANGNRVVLSLHRSLWYTFESFIRYTTQTYPLLMAVVVAVLLFVPVARGVKGVNFQFRWPGLVALYSMAMIFLCIFPVVYGYGNTDTPYRVSSFLVVTTSLLIIFDYVYLVGWFVKHRDVSCKNGALQFGLVVLTVALMATAVKFTPVMDWLTVNIVDNFARGTIQAHKAGVDEVVQTLESADGGVVVVRAPIEYYNLKGLGLSDSPDSWINRSVADYYGVDAVYYGEPDGE